MHHGRRRARLDETRPNRAARRRALSVALTGLAVIAAAGLASVGTAGALSQPFSLSPASGPPATLVGVAGVGCMHGAVASATQGYVKITATTLPISVDIPVGIGGEWSGHFTVPGNSRDLPGLVAATCFTDGAASTTTTYSPQSFTVTSAATTPTTRNAVGTPEPTPGAGAGGAPSHPAVPDAPIGNAAGSGSGTAAVAASKLATTSGAGKTVPANTSSGSHHRLWLWWLIFAFVVLTATSLLLWHRNRPRTKDDTGLTST